MNYLCRSITRCAGTFLLPSKMVVRVPHSFEETMLFHSGNPLFAEPMKKKKKMDPALIKAREERRRKRLEKSIKKLERTVKQLKPLEETDQAVLLKNEAMIRKREKRSNIEEDFKNHLKPWTEYCKKKSANEEQIYHRVLASQLSALEEVKNISEDLYSSCLEIDEKLIPFTSSGPKETAMLANYSCPDGEWIDETPKWNEAHKSSR